MTGNLVVDEIGKLNISGNVIPNHWYQLEEFRFLNGQLNFLSIIILADILYWYRPREIREEYTGKTIGYKKSFKADKLQRSYRDLAERFGSSKKQVTEACHFLADKGIITLEFRTIEVNTGTGPMRLSNVLYISPVVECIKKLVEHTLPSPKAIPSTPPGVHPITLQGDTYTEITTETTTQIKTGEMNLAKPKLKKTSFKKPEQDEIEIEIKIEDMNANEIIENLKSKGGSTMYTRWLRGMSLKGTYSPPLIMKEKAQLKRLGVLLGDQKFAVLDWALENWNKFAGPAAASAGLATYPQVPSPGFLLKHHGFIVNKMQLIAENLTKQETVQHTKKVEIEVQPKHQKETEEIYKPSAEQIAKLLAELKE